MQITTIGLDIAKNVFQVLGIDATEKVVVRKQLRRGQVIAFFRAVAPSCRHGSLRHVALSGARVRRSSVIKSRLMPAKRHAIAFLDREIALPWVLLRSALREKRVLERSFRVSAIARRTRSGCGRLHGGNSSSRSSAGSAASPNRRAAPRPTFLPGYAPARRSGRTGCRRRLP